MHWGDAEREGSGEDGSRASEADRLCLGGGAERGCERLILAYEPVWAIGTGKRRRPSIAEEAHAFCREC